MVSRSAFGYTHAGAKTPVGALVDVKTSIIDLYVSLGSSLEPVVTGLARFHSCGHEIIAGEFSSFLYAESKYLSPV